MKIYIWGTGRLAGKLIGKCIDENDIIAFIDNNPRQSEFIGKKVYKPDCLPTEEYDAIVVANMYSSEIREQCKNLGIQKEKIIYLYNNLEISDWNEDYDFVCKILGKSLAHTVKTRYHLIRNLEYKSVFEFTDEYLLNDGYWKSDYIRVKNLELIVSEIIENKVKGSIAEIGVFKGEFSQYLNRAFIDRKLYLFDTFEGFCETEAEKELNDGNCTDAFIQSYKETNIEEVMKKMRYPDNVILKKGYFPESLNGLEELFALVSIDVDFEDSIYECLKYFYPRMTKGAYALIHDYNSELRGVAKAIKRYEEDFGAMHKVPLCDACGTMIIVK